MSSIIVNYEKSNNDTPVLIVAREGIEFFSCKSTTTIIKTFVGDEATELYKKLTSKESK